MSVRSTILLLLTLVALVFTSGLMTVRQMDEEKFMHLSAERREVWHRSVSELLARQAAPLAKLVEHHSTLDRTLPAILAEDVAWARQTWDDEMLNAFGANAVWAFKGDGSLFHHHRNFEAELRHLPIPPKTLSEWRSSAQKVHFFLRLPHATGDQGERFLEVCGAPVLPAWDTGAQTRPQAFLLAGKLWDDEMLRDLPLLTGDDRIYLAGADRARVRPRPMNTSLVYDTVLRDWQGKALARLVVENDSPALDVLHSRGERLFQTFLLGSLALFLTLFLLLSRSLVRPIRLMIRGLHDGDLTRLQPLAKQKSEFGDLARLIHEFLAQRSALVREMTERTAAQQALQKSEEMLQHSQKMDAIGRLAGGVAHDFNNLLTAIIGYAHLLTERLRSEPAARQEAQLILQAGEQAAGLTRQLLAFSRKQLLQPRVIDLNQVVTNLQKLLQRIIGEHIEIQTSVRATHSRVKADPGQIEQVIVNLGVNARDAMPRGGRLTIGTANVVHPGSEDLPPGEYVALEVVDTGEGMDPETRGRIFEPFFTTKGPGKGTGLGLATVYGIIKQSRGGITVESERGQGSTFRILLPIESGPLEVQESAVVAPAASRGAERILVVEDEEIVRELVCEVLTSSGYEVLAANRGHSALELLARCASEIDLLISDVVMPEMDGAALARRVREVAPHAKVLFVSGYSESDMADQGLDFLSFEVLQKPFTPAALAAKVRETLDRAPKPSDEGPP